MIRAGIFAVAMALGAGAALAQDTSPLVVEPAMSLSRMAEIVFALDENAVSRGNLFELTVAGARMLIITDPAADRMRAMIPIRAAEGLTPDDLQRMMQANFDSALDARYAVAQGRVWAVFIHPLSPLTRAQFISGIGQTVNVAQTYGTLFTGGAMQFGGGDSDGLQRALIDELLKKGQAL